MRGLRSILLVWILFAAVHGVSRGENPLTPDVQRALIHAKNIYLVSGHVRFPKTKAFIKTEWVDSTPFEQPLHNEFDKWGRFTVVSDPKAADLIIRAYMTGSTQSVPVFTPGVTGTATVGSTFIVLDAVEPSSRRILWSASKNSGRSWSTNSAVSGLVKNFRKFLEEQDKTQVAENASAPLANSSSGTNANGTLAAPDQQRPVYGPLTYNRKGSDFYIAQDGKFAPAIVSDGIIEIHLHPSSFQIGYNGEQMNLCLAQSPFPETRADPTGHKASCLSGPFTGAREKNSDAVLVYGGRKWSDGNTELSDATSMKASPMEGFQFAYQVNQLQFVEARDMTLSHFKGTLYGYIVVYKQHERSNKDIMPIRLVFE